MSERFDLFHVFADLHIVFPDYSILDFKSVEKVLLDDLEFKIWFTLQNFKNKQWAQNIFLFLFKRSVFVFLVLFLANMV